MITAENYDNTSPSWWTLAQMLVWILQQVDLSPQDAEQFCHLNPKTIEVALNALVRALFNAIYGAAEGLPVVAARIMYGRHYKDLAALFPPLPSLEPGAVDALKNELGQFIRRQPDIQFNPTWGRWTWPVCVSAAQAAPIPTRLSESAVADEAEPLPSSRVRSEESQPPGKPDSVAAPMPVNVGYVDPDVASAIDHAVKRARPAHTVDEIVAEIVKSVSDSLARSGEAKAPGSDPAARAEESMPKSAPAVESEPVPPAESPRVEPGRDVDAADTPVQGTQVKPGGPQLPSMAPERTIAADVGDQAGAVTAATETVPPPSRPPDNAPEIEHVVWAVRFLRITAPNKLAGLRGKKLQNLVCDTVGPKFSCGLRTVQRGKKRADSM
jgi:hypothetical protein